MDTEKTFNKKKSKGFPLQWTLPVRTNTWIQKKNGKRSSKSFDLSMVPVCTIEQYVDALEESGVVSDQSALGVEMLSHPFETSESVNPSQSVMRTLSL